jgi:thiomorpholine-carboxylate dehydrogenase
VLVVFHPAGRVGVFQLAKMSEVLYLGEETVKRLLNWNATFRAMETAMESVCKKRAVQSARTFTKSSRTDSLLLTMPGYLDNGSFGALGCKLVTVAPNNANLEKPLPTINSHIMLFDDATGVLKAVISGTEITQWRTAAASAVATKHLKPSRKFEILAILGAGAQGRIHAIAFQHFFKFKEVRIWNRNRPRAERLVSELNQSSDSQEFKCFGCNRECVEGADVIVTATFAKEAIVQLEWLKEGAHVNAVGAGLTHHSELSESIYLRGEVYVDHRTGAEVELVGLKELGVEFKGEIGSLIAGDLSPPPSNRITVFQSLGMAVEDCAMARLVYDLYKTA